MILRPVQKICSNGKDTIQYGKYAMYTKNSVVNKYKILACCTINVFLYELGTLTKD